MKRIGIISDTHGNNDAIGRCVAEAGAVDAWCHLGDFSADAAEIERLSGKPVYSVRGNTDRKSASPDELVVTFEGVKLLLMHGHKYDVNADEAASACRHAEELECNVLCYGHTHVPEISNAGDLLVLNPGSPSRPLKGSRASFAIAEIRGCEVSFKLITLPEKINDKDKPTASYVAALVAAILMFALTAISVKLFEYDSAYELIGNLSDCFLIPGGLLAGVGALSWIGSQGFFDIFGFGVKTIADHFRPKHATHEKLYDYQKRREEKRKPWLKSSLYVGLGFIAISLLLIIVYELI